MFNTYQDEVEFALGAVRAAARLVRQIRRELVSQTLSKSDKSPVTVADFASQAWIAHLLKESFPDDVLVAEEDSAALKSPEQASILQAIVEHISQLHSTVSEELVCSWIDRGGGEPGDRYWVLDPIDGTKGYLRGDQYVVALALIEAGQVVLGVLGCPNLDSELRPQIDGTGSVVIAVRGGSAWATGLEGGSYTRLKVSNIRLPKQARVLRSFEDQHTNSRKLEQLLVELGTKTPPVLMDSQAKFALLAGGKGDLLFRLLSTFKPDYIENIWDQAAGSIVVEEAGGRVTDLHGKPLDFRRGRSLSANLGVLVSNGWLHEIALTAIEKVGANRRPERS